MVILLYFLVGSTHLDHTMVGIIAESSKSKYSLCYSILKVHKRLLLCTNNLNF